MKITSNSPADTLKLGQKIAKYLAKGDIVCLFGNLGSGKTVLTKGIAGGLGINKNKIISPTFVLIRQQRTKADISFYHFDLYRLGDCHEIEALGHEEYFYGDGITVIEWPDRLSYLMPKEYLMVKLTLKSRKKRLIELAAVGNRYKKIIERLE